MSRPDMLREHVNRMSFWLGTDMNLGVVLSYKNVSAQKEEFTVIWLCKQCSFYLNDQKIYIAGVHYIQTVPQLANHQV